MRKYCYCLYLIVLNITTIWDTSSPYRSCLISANTSLPLAKTFILSPPSACTLSSLLDPDYFFIEHFSIHFPHPLTSSALYLLNLKDKEQQRENWRNHKFVPELTSAKTAFCKENLVAPPSLSSLTAKGGNFLWWGFFKKSARSLTTLASTLHSAQDFPFILVAYFLI